MAKILAMNQQALSIFLCFILLGLGLNCADDDTPVILPELSTNSGQLITLDGQWESGCVEDLGANLAEIFTFSGSDLIIDILLFTDDNCDQQLETDRVDINYTADETFQARLDGQMVLANKIRGSART